MKIRKNWMTGGLAVCLCLTGLTACSQPGSAQPANELHFPLDNISDVTISYDEETITFFQSDSNALVVQEYMTENKESYHAKVDQHGSQIHISEGGKPFFKDNFHRYIEVYLPASYQEGLTVTTTDGDIDLSDVDLNLTSLRIDSTAGTVQLHHATAADVYLSSTSGTLNVGEIEADTIRLETTSGTASCEELNGYVAYSSTSGDLEIKDAIGSGIYKANNSGKLQVAYSEVSGDLYLFNKNDTIDLTLPENLAFQFVATTKNGSVSTTFQECVSIDGQTISGTVGTDPSVTVEVETKNGDIQVNQ